MTWFGTVSAWAALAMSAMFGVNAYFQFATGAGGWIMRRRLWRCWLAAFGLCGK